MGDYQNLINIFIYSVIPTSFAYFFTKKIEGKIKNSFDKKLEVIKKEHAIEIAKFQTDLTHLKSKENFKFTKLHEKRFEVLEQTYKHIINNIDLLGQYVLSSHDSSDKNNYIGEKIISAKYIDSYQKFAEYFDVNAIYFNEEIQNLIIDYLEEVGEVYINHTIKHNTLSIIAGSSITKGEIIKESRNLINFKLQPIKKQIEIKFRELLGE